MSSYHNSPYPSYLKRGQCVALVLALSTLATPVSAAGLSVTPSRLEATTILNQPHSFTLTASNPTSEVALIEVYPDNFQNIITAEPTSFTLESGQEQKIRVTVTPDAAGTFSTLLSIVSRPLGDRSFNAGTGIKIPLQIEAVENNSEWPAWMIIIAIIDSFLGIVLLWLLVNKRIKMRGASIRRPLVPKS